MAIDSKDKRANAPLVGIPPMPDGSIDQGDRQQAAGVYRGVPAAGAATSNLIAMERAAFRCTFGRVWGRVN